jgi:NLR family CARD domain-containing protein 3
MASATVLPTLGINGLSIHDQHRTNPADGDTSNASADYWTTLIRKNLEAAQSAEGADSDAEDALSTSIDEEIMNAPRRKSPRDALAREIANRLYPAPPDSLAPIIKYEKDIVMLRSM